MEVMYAWVVSGLYMALGQLVQRILVRDTSMEEEVKVPPQLLNQFGTPTLSGQTYRWQVEGGASDDVWCWQPGWAHAYNRHTKGTIPVAFGEPERFRYPPSGDPKNQIGLVSHPWPEHWVTCELEDPYAAVCDAHTYLEDRGLTAEEIAAYAVSDTSRTHLAVFPIVEDGKLVGWQGRNVYGHEPKCVSGAVKDGWIPCRKLVWGIDRCFPGKTAYVAEGIFDALMFDHGCATMGSALGDTQVVKILDRRPSDIVVLGQNKDHEDVAETRAGMFKTFTDLDVSIDYAPPQYEDYGVMLSLRKEDEDGRYTESE